jgi:DNA-binding transcriptional ArsR family regulator
MSKIELILHPIRMRIIMALAAQQLTPGQIAEQLADVPQTSLYRHLNTLAQAGLLTVVEERPVRGTIEKVYRLVEGGGRLSAEEMTALSKEDHLRYFMVFLSSLLQDFSQALDKREGPDVLLQDVVYNKIPLMLTDAERDALAEQFRALVVPYMARADADPQRKRYTFALISIADE